MKTNADLENLAVELDEFHRIYDIYDYEDTYDTRDAGAGVEAIIDTLENYDGEEIVEWLEEIGEYEEGTQEDITWAAELLEKVRDYIAKK